MSYNLCLHIDSRDPATLRLLLKNAANYYKALPDEKFQLVIVANGPAVCQFTNTNTEMNALAAPLLEKGMQINLCANALAENQIAKNEIWSGCAVVPAGVVEIVRLQQQGFAYIKP